jgi:glycosyltransferase involved in cell wall biosynthesis
MAENSGPHILLIHQAFVSLDEPGGTRHHELARILAKKGHRVTIIASPVSYLTGQTSKTTKDKEPGIVIRRAFTYQALHRSFVHRVISFLSFMISSFFIGLSIRDVDIVWGTSPPIFQGVTAWGLARLKRAPFLFEVRDLWPAFAVAIGVLKNPFLIQASLWLERFLYRRATRLVVNSPGFTKHVQERGGKNVAIIPNGADSSMFDPDENGASFRKKHGLAGKFVVLYAGAHGVSNDLAVVLAAANQLKQQENIAFILLGDGKEKPALIENAGKMGLQNTLFLPPLAKKEMALALAAADICIAILKPLPEYATVYPNKVFDYMAAGRPVLLAIDGVIREAVEAAGAGIFVQPGDSAALATAIKELTAHPNRARRMGASGRAYLEKHFDRAELAEKLHQVILELVAKK